MRTNKYAEPAATGIAQLPAPPPTVLTQQEAPGETLLLKTANEEANHLELFVRPCVGSAYQTGLSVSLGRIAVSPSHQEVCGVLREVSSGLQKEFAHRLGPSVNFAKDEAIYLVKENGPSLQETNGKSPDPKGQTSPKQKITNKTGADCKRGTDLINFPNLPGKSGHLAGLPGS